MPREEHGYSGTRIYKIRGAMIQRCNNKNATGYKNYGGRGIKVCKGWMDSAESFIEWSYRNGYKDTLTIDRIDNEKGYEPSNCRWVTMHENILNQESNKGRTIEDKYISETKAGTFTVNICKMIKSKVKVLYRETFLTKDDAMKARDLYEKEGVETRIEKHHIGDMVETEMSDQKRNIMSRKKRRDDRDILRKEALSKKRANKIRNEIYIVAEIIDESITEYYEIRDDARALFEKLKSLNKDVFIYKNIGRKRVGN